MPLEIKELVIRATVQDEEKPKASPQSAAADDKEALIEECVDKVLEILRNQKER